jgi:hypothetical protein
LDACCAELEQATRNNGTANAKRLTIMRVIRRVYQWLGLGVRGP